MTYLENGKTLTLDRELCTGCGMCGIVCPHAVYSFTDRKADIAVRGNCMECGACMINCPVGAIPVDKGVGCAAAVIQSRLKGRKESSCCGGSEEKESSCCGGSEEKKESPCCGGGGCC